jgi:hypothetical protein
VLLAHFSSDNGNFVATKPREANSPVCRDVMRFFKSAERKPDTFGKTLEQKIQTN